MKSFVIGPASVIKADEFPKALPWIIICIILTSIVSGCSIIGLSLGAAADHDHPDRVNWPVNDTEQIKPGANIELVLQSGDTLIGKFKGTGRLSDGEYESIFHACLNESSELDKFPAPGDTIAIFDHSGNKFEFVLTGYNNRYLSVHRKGEDKSIAVLRKNISNVTSGRGETIFGADLEKMISERRLPVFQTLVLERNGETTALPADSIVQLAEIDINNRIWKGLAIGLAIDLAVSAWFIYSIRNAHFE